MSQDLLEKILKDKIDSNLDEVIKFLTKFKKNEYIYPSTIKRNLKLEDKKIYEILTLLEDADIIKMYYEVFCYNCNNSKGLYTYFNELDDDLICDSCENNLNSNDNVKIVYKVIK